MLRHLLTERHKYTNAIPLYRIAQDFEQNDMILGRATMANWVIRCSERYLSLVYDRMREYLCRQSVIQADETTCQVTKDGREGINKSYMFVYRTSELSDGRPVVLYQYGKTRSKRNIQKFLQGFSGTLVSDAFSGYKSLDQNDENIRSAFCWAHARRDYADALKALKGDAKELAHETIAHKALVQIAQIYKAEEALKDLSAEERQTRRHKEVLPLVEAYFAWVHEQDPATILSEKTRDGLKYSLNQEKYLKVFLENGEVPIDNSATERAIRPFTIGRANWHIIDTIPAQAEVVQRIYQQYLVGASIRMIANALEADHIPNAAGEPTWTITAVRGILTNEKYCGDVLRQKTFRSDCISGKVIRNTGQLPMYLIENHHEGIVDRKTFDAVQAEMARRNAGKSPSKKNAPTGLTSYASKNALSERLVCGECGTLYRRCTWSKYGKKRIVWRCVSRLDYGTKYCHDSPTMDEGRLQRSILAAINAVMSQKQTLVQQVADAMELELLPCSGGNMSMADMDRRMAELELQFQELLQQAADSGGYEVYTEQFKALAEEAATLKERRAQLVEARRDCEAENRRLNDAVQTLQQAPAEIQEWNETLIRQLIETVSVISAEEIIVTLKGGTEIRQNVLE